MVREIVMIVSLVNTGKRVRAHAVARVLMPHFFFQIPISSVKKALNDRKWVLLYKELTCDRPVPYPGGGGMMA